MSYLAVLGFFKKYWLPVLGVILVVGIALYARGCYVQYKQNQVQEEINVERQKVIDAQVAEEAADVEGKREDAVNKGKNTNEANKKLNDARGTDSSRGNSNASAVKQRFCAAYPEDSICQ